ncbi:RNA polymerase ECF-type sigma factor [Filimonas lacunae]|nr:RNA polymerase ECF-type sigma factor [Filimonas lacunae]
MHSNADEFEVEVWNEASFERFFKEKFASLCASCQYKFDLGIDETKDIVHAAFIKLWQLRDEVEPCRATAFLVKVIGNSALDSIKHSQVRQKYARVVKGTAEEADDGQFDVIDAKVLSAKIQGALQELPGQMRVVFELSRLEGLTYAAIAAQLNISVKTVETQMSRALTKMRTKLSDYILLLMALVQLFTFF